MINKSVMYTRRPRVTNAIKMIELDVQSYLFASRDEIKFECHATCNENERVEGTLELMH